MADIDLTRLETEPLVLKGYLGAIAAISDTIPKRWHSDALTDVTPSERVAAIREELLAATSALGGLGSRDIGPLPDAVARRVLPLLRMVQNPAEALTDMLEDSSLAGSDDALELIYAVLYAVNVGLALWAPVPARI